MRFICSACEGPCEHIGAAISLVLEEKSALGLTTEPPEQIKQIDLTEEELVARELMRRGDRARTERLKLKSVDPRKLWTDYVVTISGIGKILSRGPARMGARRVVLLVSRLQEKHPGNLQTRYVCYW